MAPCRTRAVANDPVAAGERIVAFERPGKPLEGPFLGPHGGPPLGGKPPDTLHFSTLP
jgi:hypothetical protein